MVSLAFRELLRQSMIAGILVKVFLERSCHTVPQVAAGALRGIVSAS
jgi:hypothetical protein